jgi:hypothetical protein
LSRDRGNPNLGINRVWKGRYDDQSIVTNILPLGHLDGHADD